MNEQSVHVCSWICKHVCTCSWKPEAYIKCLPQFLHSIFSESVSHTLELTSFCSTDRPALGIHPPVSASPALMPWYTQLSEFYTGSGTQTWGFMSGQQALCTLRHCPTPESAFSQDPPVVGLFMKNWEAPSTSLSYFTLFNDIINPADREAREDKDHAAREEPQIQLCLLRSLVWGAFLCL